MSILKKLVIFWLILKVAFIAYFLITIDIPSVPPEISPQIEYGMR